MSCGICLRTISPEIFKISIYVLSLKITNLRTQVIMMAFLHKSAHNYVISQPNRLKLYIHIEFKHSTLFSQFLDITEANGWKDRGQWEKRVTITAFQIFHDEAGWYIYASSLDQIMAGRLFGAKPLSEPILTYCQLDLKEHISMKFKVFIQENALQKCRLQNCLSFCLSRSVI